MEPRIAKLLGDSLHDRNPPDPISLLPPPSVAPLRPHPVEPPPGGDDARANPTPRRADYVGNDRFGSKRSPTSAPPNRQKSSVSIAEVLNKENPTPAPPHPLPALSSVSTTPFSGRLSDILLDPSQEFPNKRRKVDEHTSQPAMAGGENALLKLPKLPQLPKKTTKRPRIPPLLQGLHQPPPLPERLFPPITGEGVGFARDIGDRVGLPSTTGLGRGKDVERDNVAEMNAPVVVNHDTTPKKAINPVTQPERGKDDPPSIGEPAPVAVNERDEQEHQDKDPKVPEEGGKTKETRKRNKWTEQETKDLLVGVSRFGIGNWKKILQCPDFTFNGRTAVDLKDRFRTCCPGEGLKIRKPKNKGTVQEAEPQHAPESANTVTEQDGPSQEISQSDISTKQRKPRGDIHRKGPAELAKMGISGPFVKSKRRERREFTDKDDENLLRGFEKYGAVWHSMRDDQELGFSMRHPTDLRDRFRIRYPEKYAKAGYKLKPKDEQLLRGKDKEPSTQDSASALSANQSFDSQKEKERDKENAEEITNTGALVSVPSMSTSAPSSLRAHALLQPLLNSYPTPLEEVVDLVSEDGEGGHSPITLSRNIFHWADANSSHLASSSSNIPAVGNLAGDMSLNLFGSVEEINNPLVGIHLPLAAITNTTLSALPYDPTSTPLTLSLPAHPIPNANASLLSGHSSSSNVAIHPAISSAKASTNPLLRTPNLPTIVFPHVPAASARSAVHNLPPPADLLSGLDLDPRNSEAQSGGGFVFDEGMGFALPSGASATLAPLLGGNSVGGVAIGAGSGGGSGTGRGILNAERGLLVDEGMGGVERR